MPLDFNDYVRICREEFTYLVDISREFVREAQQTPRSTPKQQYAQYVALLDKVKSPAMVAIYWDKMKGKGEGEKYLKAMGELEKKYGGTDGPTPSNSMAPTNIDGPPTLPVRGSTGLA